MLSQRCIYGIRAMLYLASQPESGYVSIRQISDRLGFSYAFLTKVLQALNRRGLLRSHRGPNGGVALARPPEEVTLGTIIDAIDGPALFETCILGLPACDADAPCTLHPRWEPMRSRLHTLFYDVSIQDLVAPGASAGRIDEVFSESLIKTKDS